MLLDRLTLLSPREREQLLVEWNATDRTYASDVCVHELFDAQVVQRPDAVAIVYEDAQLSYGELDARANRLAHYLRTLGVGPDRRVALCLERSVELVVSILAVLKAGGAYVPLDPSYPSERLQYMLDDSAPVAVLTHGAIDPSVRALLDQCGVPTIDLDDAAAWAGQPSSAPKRADLRPSHAAYVIYTSGSTGRPKGVIVEHRSLYNMTCVQGDHWDIDCNAYVLQAASSSFDASVLEIMLAITHGAELAIANSQAVMAGEMLGRLLEEAGVTHALVTPSVLSTISQDQTFRSLRVLLVGAEAPTESLVRRWGSGRRFFNLYGPTEATVFATMHECDPKVAGDPPIGRPIGNVRTYVLDAYGDPVPIGVAGELYIGGVQVARGYLNRAELTAERFVPDPFGGAGARLYRTGDLARYRNDGTLEFLGRGDFQVKIRGFRIELGEIEGRLREHPDVREAVVVAREDTPGDKRLVAYYTGAEGAEFGASELRAHLQAVLPEYMVPAAYVALEQLPLLPNGKLDRRSLPAPDDAAYTVREYEAPVGEIEETLASIWRELLGVQRVGRHDNFFQLGGHSLLVVRAIERMRRLGLYADVATFFTAPSLAGVAAMVRTQSAAVVVPPNGIVEGCEEIEPWMVPLIELDASEIDRIVAAVPGGTRNIADIYPLAPLQEGILFHHLLESGRDPYVLQSVYRFADRAKLDAYLAALQVVIDRHDVLRTAVVWEGLREPVQVVWRRAPLSVEEIVVGEGEEAVAALSARFDLQTYRLDVGRAPMMHVGIAREQHGDGWVMALLTHHLIGDHVTGDIIEEEIAAHLSGRAESLAPALPFRNFIAQARLGVSRAEHEAYFRSLLGDVEEPTAPFGLLDVRGDGSSIAQAKQWLEPEVSQRLRGCARALGVSTASLCHVAWAQVLAQTSGRSDVVFGTVLFGRMQGEGSDRAMGLFINTLPVRIALDDRSVVEVVKQTQAQLAQLLHHEHASLALAQRRSAVPPSVTLFSALLNYRHIIPSSQLAAPRPEGMEQLGGEERSNYPFSIDVNDLGEELSLKAQVDASLDPERICALMQTALVQLVDALEEAPSRSALSLRTLPPAEREQLVEWNATDRTYASDVCVHELFDAQVVQRPDAVAIVYEDAQLSYGELDARANRLAHYLRTLGVGPDRRVALCLERSVELVVSILAVLKAGGAYVPLDPSYPSERLQYMLDDSAPVAVLTHGAIDPSVRALLDQCGVPTIDLDDAAAWAGQPSSAPKRADLCPSHAAYVIYTSGSTGRPKGVIVEHRSLANQTRAVQERCGITGSDRVLQFSAITFDASLEEVFGSLTCGAALILRSDAWLAEPQRFWQLCHANEITLLDLPTLFWEELAQDGVAAIPACVRAVVIGGQAVGRHALEAWFTRDNRPALLNSYGPTETTVDVTVQTVTTDETTWSSIGRPIANMRTYILDAYGDPVPIGVTGELYVGGAQVARGYLNRAELTAERFVPDPFGGAGARLYRTGDLARYRNDGTLEFLGRGDFQVKIRGFRIELGEIEGRLREHPDVREAVVVAREDTPGDKRLVAYYTGAEGAEFGASELRAHLQAVLPEYMVPGAYVALEQLPLLPNGKLDRRSLPAPDGAAYTVREYEAPVGEIEETLASIWRELLKLERVGRHDNFFELGGHSLLAVRLLSRIRQALHVDIGLTELFTRPTLSGFAQALRDARHATSMPIVAVERTQRLPLSFAQQRLWFLAQLEGGSEAYHIPFGIRLRGRLDQPALSYALNRIIARHEVLRTAFAVIDGEPEQYIAPPEIGFALGEHDLRDRPDAVQQLIDQEASAPFDLERGPLIRGRLIALADDEHVLLVTMHHIVSDGWSMGVFMRELSTLYTAFSRGRDDPLSPLSLQYADYAVWQRRWLSGDVLQAQTSYWREALSGAPVLLELPWDRPRPVVQDYHGEYVRIELDAELSAGLRALSRRHGTTLFMTLLSAWGALVSRLSGQSEVVIGTPVANRTRPEIEELIGFFVNTLALRLDYSGSPPVSELLERVKMVALSAQEHQDVPFEQVVELLNPPRSLSHTPLFQTMFVWEQDDPGERVLLPNMTTSWSGASAATSKFDVSLTLFEDGELISGGLRYASALFDRTTVERWAGYLPELLSAMVADDARRIDGIGVLPAAEREQLVEWNATDRTYASDVCVHELFDAQVVQRPDAVAIVYEDAQLSYGELDARANRLAHYLRTLGVGPDRRVALCLERSVELIVSILAVLKAGGAYVPLDPSYPSERLQYMLDDSAPVAVLTHGAIDPSVRALLDQCGVPTIDLDDAAAWAGQPSSAPKRADLRPSHAAYVIYTSGSTGRPKGVIVEHWSLVNLLLAIQTLYPLHLGNIELHKTQSSFDPAVREVLQPLVHGARLVLARAEGHKDPRYLAEVIRAERITTLHFVPSMLELFVEQEQSSGCTSLQRITCGGEALPGWLAVRCLERLPWVELVNFYGPAEATVDATTWSCARSVSGGSIPIGRPIGNVRTYVLDAYGDPVPIGVAGELYIGGVQVARGYLNRAELTAERFVPDPFGGAGARLYRTGDLARYRNDGTLEFLGRGDFQVKIRGFRIELGEIEGRLREHPDVREAVVVAREDTPGDKRLVAYYTGAEGAEFGASELRAHLQAVLPEYMVPAAYVALEQLPLLPNGKLDRRSLPAPDGAAYTVREYEAPVGEIEEALASIWRELLGVQRVGRHDNFFQLGGHSLLVVRAIERMRRLGLYADVATFFTAPSLAGVAAMVRTQSAAVVVPPNGIVEGCEEIEPWMVPLIELDASEIDRIVAAVPGGTRNIADIYPLAPLQEGILFHHLLESGRDPYVLRSIYRFEHRARLDAYLAALQVVIDRHDILRTAVLWEGLREPVQVVWRRAPLSVEEIVVGEGEEAVAALSARFDLQTYRLDVGRAPMMHVGIAREQHGDGWVMAFLTHHLIRDHVTGDIFDEEIRAHLTGQADTLPPPYPFRNYIVQARLGVSKAEHEAYFRSLLADVDEPTAPFGLLDVHRDGSAVLQAHRRLHASLSQRLRSSVRRVGVSVASLCHVAWANVLARASGKSDVVFGTVLFGRMHSGMGADRAMGMFINTLPVRITVDDRNVERSVLDTHAQLARLLHHEHASLTLVQQCSAVAPTTPLFTSIFNYRHILTSADPSRSGALDGIEEIGDDERTSYPFTMCVNDFGDDFSLVALVDRTVDAERVCSFMETALELVVDALDRPPGRAVALLDVLPTVERRQLVEWNATDRTYASDVCVHELFDAQVVQRPDAVAIVYEDAQLSYGELDARANRLAHYLRTLGVGPDRRVALCLERSVELIVSILAVLKAGGAYVPLDPSYPSERLQYMLDDSAPVAVLTHGAIDPSVRALLDAYGAPTIDLDDDAAWADEPSTAPSRDGLTPRHAAYVIYTSGSTGRPKGVIVEHGNVTRLFGATQRWFAFGPTDVWTLFHSFAFDFSVWELFGALLYGGRLVIVPHLVSRSPEAFYDLLCQVGVTVLNQTPSAFGQLIEAQRQSSQEHALHCVIFGGEALDTSMLAPWYEDARNGSTRLINMYGITETTVHVTYREVGSVSDRGVLGSLIGERIADLQVYVLDSKGNLAPIGVPGELYVGGGGVARGYLNRAELTAERFVPDPFGGAGARLYRTGDLARYRNDGTLEFLGRGDFQVKIRGFRIELGEIEGRLREHPDVREAVVVAREDTPGDKRLVAYYTGAEGAEFGASELRAHLQAVLPEYMVPGAYVALEQLPLLPNGKLDRRSLPAPDGAAYTVREYEAPVGEIEETLASIWRELLGVQRVGRHDNFFQLGGHSLLAVRLLSRVRQGLQLEANLSALFLAPTLSAFAEVVQRSRSGALESIPLVPIDRNQPLPLSFAQQRLWFLAQLEGGSEAYHISLGVRLQGVLDRAAFRQALDRIVARHESLRTTFASIDGEPVQQIAPADVGFALGEHDLRDRPDAVQQLIDQEASAPFDLERGPLIRGRLIALADDEHVLLVTMHHIVSDGWSMGVFMRELSTLYTAFSRGRDDPLSPLSLQYADYAVWQRRWLSGDVLQAQTSYWREALSGAPVLLELPWDRPRPVVQDYHGEYVRIELDAELSAGLRALSRRHGTTLFMTLLSAWGALVSRLSGQSEVVIGTPVANRTRPEIEELIGFFVNTLALRLDYSGSPPVSELLERVKMVALSAQEHQDVPFEQVVELLNPPRSLSHTPLFQTMFSWQEGDRDGNLRLKDLELSPAGAAAEVAKFDLLLALSESRDAIGGELKFARSLFDRTTVERWAGYLPELLSAMVADDARRIDGIGVLPAAEREQLVEWNATDRTYASDVCVHELFDAQVVQRPDAVAIVYEDAQLSYGELDVRANRLAHYLRTLGVGPDRRVALCLERSVELIVSILAVLKAGGAYVPLDPSYPSERLQYMLSDCAPVAVLTHGAIDPSVRALLDQCDVPTIDLDDAAAWAGQPSSAPKRADLCPSHAAYVIYTSGSTGRPKGVIVEHCQLSAKLQNARERFAVGAHDVLPNLASYAFDISLLEILVPLISGGSTLLIGTAEVKDVERLIERTSSATIFHAVPSLMAAWLNVLRSANDVYGALRAILVGGEAVPDRLLRTLVARFPNAEIVELYGPTEATIISTAFAVRDASLPAVPYCIGFPLANTRTYILDAYGDPVPIGVTGELYVGGAQVARGYLNRAELTAERFVPDPFGGAGARLYRTGDLARYRNDGTLEFLGRGDFQVKIRGFRIELGEIEGRLREHPDVREAVVVAREDTPGDKRLVAYYTGAEGAEFGASELRAHLQAVLPEYMVPAAYVALEQLPLLPNGKLDRRSLPAPDGAAYTVREYEAPVGEIEETLASIWRELLKLERVGRHDNFFELGGHSLLAVRLLSRIRQALHVDIGLTELFTRPTLSGFAQALRDARHATSMPIVAVERTQRLPLSFAQQRLWFLAQLEGGSEAYHIPFGIRLRGRLDQPALSYALNRIIARHEVLRTAFAVIDGEPEQYIAPPEIGFALGEHDLRDRPDAVQQLIDQEASAPFDLERGPLIRGRLIALADDEHVLLVTMHHIVSDGWSMGVFMRELSTLYTAFSRGRDDPLSPLSLQYADYAVWQRRWLSGDVLQAQTSYWREALSGAPVLLELPWDRPRPVVQDYHGEYVRIELDAELSAGLRALSRRHGTTLFMTLLSAWGALVSRLSGQSEVVIGTPVANRTRPEIEELIGFFVNTLALRLDYSGSPPVSELLERVKMVALSAQEHQDVPFEQVVELLNPPRSLSHTPLFQTMFVWEQDDPGERVLLPNMTTSWSGASAATSKFDVSLTLFEDGELISGGLRYASALFDRTTVERWAGYLPELLSAMVADDARRIDGIGVLPAAEREQLVEWNATDRTYASDVCVHELFDAQVVQRPDAVAIVYEDAQLSYGELDARANRLAHYLRTLGVGPDRRVALCLERSVELIVSILAVLKAGGAYVPLDPSYPSERLQYMLDDSAPVAVLTHGAIDPSVRALLDQCDVPTIDLDDAAAWAGQPSSAPKRADLCPSHAAYVIYTSGSTGRPKGVIVEHCQLSAKLQNARERFAVGAHDVLPNLASYAFDISLLEILVPLISGGSTLLIGTAEVKDVERLIERTSSATIFHAVPSLMAAWLNVLRSANDVYGALRAILVGGEAVPDRLLRTLVARFPNAEIVELYGPTEATIISTAFAVRDASLPAVPYCIGFPLANTRTYILDAYGDPVPIGVTGELYVGGAQVARGYLNRAELTAERFVPDPFGGAGARLYRTGDLARYRNDGTLEFLGRGDFQVKIRGFRIELGEIEGRLREHPDVREAVVVAREDTPGDKRLVAYYTGAEGAEFGASELRAHLQAVLPEYMVPAAYVALEQLPLLPNGKLDRRSLPAPDGAAYTVREYEAPVGEIEETLASIWRELLKLERVGRHDNFFELGGHSLLAVRLLSRVRQAFDADLSLTGLFERPRLSTLAEVIQRSGAGALESIPLVPIDRNQPLPLSFAQQRLWFLAQLEGGSEAYHIPFGIRLRGRLDQPALSYALNRIIARHEVLRTAFAVIDGEPEQYIAPPEIGFMLLEHDLRDRADALARCQELIEQEAAARFDLKHGPLIRGRLIALGAEEHVLLLTMHHIVSDGWSMGVFMRELSTLYEAYHTGVADPLPALPVQYVDYAIWQRRWLSGDVLQAQTSYWQQALSSAPPLLELPWDRARPEVQDHCGDTVRFDVDAELSAKLRALSRRHGTTMFMTLLTAWGALLSRLSGQSEVVIGTPVANRMRPEIEELIGFFVNTLALRLDYSGTPTVEQMLERVKEVAILAQEHQDLPFEQVVELLNPPRSLAHTPIFQTMFSWQPDSPNSSWGLAGLEHAWAHDSKISAKFDVSLTCTEEGDCIVGWIEYATALFDKATITRYAGHLTKVLYAMVDDDQQLLSSLGLLSEAERHQLLVEWNQTEKAYPSDTRIHELFEAQAARTPDAIALTHNECELSYGQLNERANRLAHYLRELGVQPDSRVALCTERSLEMVVGLLAVLKAGGAYVPLDPHYPVQRLRYMLEDSGPQAALVDDSLSDELKGMLSQHDLPTINLTDELPTDSLLNPDRDRLTARDLAYVMYTSGSTGRPKGVMVEHRGLCNFIEHLRGFCHVHASDRVLQFASISFDASVEEIFLALSSGAALVIADRQWLEATPEEFWKLCDWNRISWMEVPTILWEQLSSTESIARSVQEVFIGGEPISPPVMMRWFVERGDGLRLINVYGPTEASVTSNLHEMRADGYPWRCIGRPIANTRAYILDETNEPVPVGVVGELYIGGDGVARGYLNKEDLTAERFIMNPFLEGDRLYRTGDLVRYLPDGNIEFLGRNDFQVKIRGFRIELGEIEARLSTYAGVREAVVVAREDVVGEKRLVTYYTSDAGAISAKALRAHVSTSLPEYMVPAAYVQLEQLPLLPNGKLDRKGLPMPDGAAYTVREYEAPVGEIEETLAQIWCELLKLERVGRNDNFFELGGHSLLLVRTIDRMQRAGLYADVRDIFLMPTLALLAATIEGLQEIRV